MRRSTYEIILPLVGEDDREIEGKALLVNGLYSSFDIVAKDDAEKIVAGDFAALSPALCEGLLLRGHLTQKSEAEEIDDMKLLGHVYRTLHARSDVSLTIMPTYDCNFRCPYCYEQHRLAKGKKWLEHTMDSGTMDGVFAALKDYRERGYALGDCTLYGGEPLLVFNCVN